MSFLNLREPRIRRGLLVLALFPILFELPVIWKFGAFAEGDAELVQKVAFIGHLRDGLSLAWTQLVDCGTIFFGSTNASLSPWDLLILWMNPVWVANLSFISYLVAGGIGFFLWRRCDCGDSSLGALVGALVYQGSSYALVNTSIGHETLMQQYGWFPWALRLVDQLAAGRRLRFWVFFPWVAFGMSLSTYPYLTWILGSIMALRLVFQMRRAAAPWLRVAGDSCSLGAAALLGFGFFGFFFVPAAHFANQAIAPGHPEFNIADYRYHITFPLTHLVTLLNPFFFGESRHGTFWSQFLAHTRIGGFHEYVIYCGLLPLATIWLARRRLLSNPEGRFWLCLLAAYALVSLGKYGGLYSLLSQLPVHRNFRGPARYTVIWPVVLAILSSLAFTHRNGADAMARMVGRATVRLAAWAAGLALAAWVATSLFLVYLPWQRCVPSSARSRMSEILNLMVMPGFSFNLAVALALAVVILGIWRGGLMARIAPTRLLVAMLAADLALSSWVVCWRPSFNYSSYQPIHPVGNYLAAHANPAGERVMDATYALPGLRCLLDRFEQIDGYKPLHLPWYQEFINRLNGQALTSYDTYDYRARNPASPLLPYLRVRYVVAEEGARGVKVDLPIEAEFGRVRIYRTTRVLPLFFLSPVCQLEDGKQARLDLIESALVSERVPLVLEGEQGPCPKGAPVPVASLEVPMYTHERGLDYRARFPEAGHPRLLGSSIVWYDEWAAFDQDGHRLRVRRANHAFLAVEVPPGTREVRLHFEAAAQRRGWWLSAASLGIYAAGLAGGVVGGLVKRRRCDTRNRGIPI